MATLFSLIKRPPGFQLRDANMELGQHFRLGPSHCPFFCPLERYPKGGKVIKESQWQADLAFRDEAPAEQTKGPLLVAWKR